MSIVKLTQKIMALKTLYSPFFSAVRHIQLVNVKVVQNFRSIQSTPLIFFVVLFPIEASKHARRPCTRRTIIPIVSPTTHYQQNRTVSSRLVSSS